MDMLRTGGRLCAIFSSWRYRGVPSFDLSTWRDGVAVK